MTVVLGTSYTLDGEQDYRVNCAGDVAVRRTPSSPSGPFLVMSWSNDNQLLDSCARHGQNHRDENVCQKNQRVVVKPATQQWMYDHSKSRVPRSDCQKPLND